jgi:hypothetical protein
MECGAYIERRSVVVFLSWAGCLIVLRFLSSIRMLRSLPVGQIAFKHRESNEEAYPKEYIAGRERSLNVISGGVGVVSSESNGRTHLYITWSW